LTATTTALGALAIWHFKLISRGETAVEAHINKSETKRLDSLGKSFGNPYNFGKSNNWKLFLGLTRGRTFWRHVLFPSTHLPEGDGVSWMTVLDNTFFQINDHQL
jgi:palmitoyltransferase